MGIRGKMLSIRYHLYGGREVLKEEQIDIPQPKSDEVLIQVKACGVNRADLLSRTGQIKGVGGLPHIPGTEVAGKVVDTGEDIQDHWLGARVMINPTLYCGECEFCVSGEDNLCINVSVFGFDTEGGYAEYVVAPVKHLIKIPFNIDYEDAAAFAATASTSWHMLVQRAELQTNETVLVIAAGSGIGVYAIQIARHLGARVIATVGNQEKKEKALALGADEVINHNEEGWSSLVRKCTKGRGVDIVFEHVGLSTWNESTRSLSRMGRLVTCGAFTGSKVEVDLWPFFSK